jgi:hypothetical protein
MKKRESPTEFEGKRILITSGRYAGTEGVCIGKGRDGKWAVSPDSTDEILSLQFEKDFGLLIDLSADPRRN